MESFCPLSSFFLFRELEPAALCKIAALLEPPVRYRRGDTVYSTHTFRRAVGLIVTGSVVVRAHGVVMNRLQAGELFGVAALFNSADEAYVTEIAAAGDTAVQFIPQELMSELLAEFPALAVAYIRFLSDRVRFLNRKLSTLTHGSTETRLYHYLAAHLDEAGNCVLPATMTELARTLNMGRSSLYRSFDTLAAEGFIRKNGKHYTVL